MKSERFNLTVQLPLYLNEYFLKHWISNSVSLAIVTQIWKYYLKKGKDVVLNTEYMRTLSRLCITVYYVQYISASKWQLKIQIKNAPKYNKVLRNVDTNVFKVLANKRIRIKNTNQFEHEIIKCSLNQRKNNRFI